jgi:hypothetical protein
MKVCSNPKCKSERQPQPLENFGKCKYAKDGLHNQCRECRNEYQREHYRTSPEYQKYQREYWQSPRGKFSIYRTRAKRKNIEFTLTLEQFKNIILQPCHYCGEYLEEKEHCGVDRVDNNLGYTLVNCVPCCRRCNRWKSALTLERFSSHVQKIYEHFAKSVIP